MKPYLAILKGRLSILFQYRAAALAGLATQIFWGAVKVMILTAFYAQATVSAPISLTQAMTFIWIGQALLQLLPWNVDKEIEAQIRNGNVAYELVRPLDLYWFWFCRSLSMRLVPTLLRSLPLFLLAGLFFGLTQPISLSAGVTFGISLIFSAFLSTAITTLVVISLFWTVAGEGILRLLPHIVLVFSGMAVPLPLFPQWMQPFLNIQPFRCIIDIPCRLYTGVIPSAEAWSYLALQLLWALIFLVLGKYFAKRAIKQFVIQGG